MTNPLILAITLILILGGGMLALNGGRDNSMDLANPASGVTTQDNTMGSNQMNQDISPEVAPANQTEPAGKNTLPTPPAQVETPKTQTSNPPVAPTTPPATATAVKEFTVNGSNFSFSPNMITVKKGDRVRITFKNTGGFHDLMIDEFKVATSKLQGGAEETVEFTADKTGNFEYYCSVGSHRQMGMRGTLIVE